MYKKKPVSTLTAVLTSLAIALLIAGSLGLYQWSRHLARRHEEVAALQLDRELGVTAEPVDDDIAADLGVPPETTGLVVTSLADGRVAEAAGLHAGDVIEQIGDLVVTDFESAAAALEANRHHRVAVILNRHGTDMRVEVPLA